MKEIRFTVTPNWKHDPVVYEIHEDNGFDHMLLCYTIRRNEADRIKEIYQCLILKIISW